MNENKSHLHYQLLEAPLIISKYVKDDDACNYEKYLIEMINKSIWFNNHFQYPFVSPQNENSGQCDAYSGEYGIDFKLVASETRLQARSIHSSRIEKLEDGVISIGSPRQAGSMQVTNFPQAFRHLSLSELEYIRKNTLEKRGLNHDICRYLEKLETKKNLLLLFPYKFTYEKPGLLKEDIESIVEQCNNDFAATLAYRSKLCPNLDTFFSFFYDYHFVLCKWFEQHLIFLESIPVESSDTFMHLALDYCEGWSEKYDVILQMIRAGKSCEEIDKELSENQ